MIEIKPRNGLWELYVNGALIHYDSDLESVLRYVGRHSEDIADDLFINQ